MTKRYRDQMTMAYGRFPPGSPARDLRNEAARVGLRVCHCCLATFEPEDAVARVYCTEQCAAGDLGNKKARKLGAREFPWTELGVAAPKFCGCAK